MAQTIARRPRHSTAVLCFASLLGAALPACAPKPLRLAFTVDPDANNNSPVSISVILVHDTAVVPKLQALSAKQWFQQRDQFLRDHPKEIEESIWEFIPGQQVPPITRKPKKAAKQGVIFAGYRSPGTHRYLFDPAKLAQIVVGQKGLVLPP